jgi:hypothetical protein
MLDALWIKTVLEESGRGLIEVLFRHFPGGSEGNYEKS